MQNKILFFYHSVAWYCRIRSQRYDIPWKYGDQARIATLIDSDLARPWHTQSLSQRYRMLVPHFTIRLGIWLIPAPLNYDLLPSTYPLPPPPPFLYPLNQNLSPLSSYSLLVKGHYIVRYWDHSVISSCLGLNFFFTKKVLSCITTKTSTEVTKYLF